MKRKLDVVTKSIQFTFDGGLEPVSIHMSNVGPACATYAMLHGFSARIGDSAALSRKQKDGSIVTITEQMRRDEIVRLVEHYESGTAEWDMGRTPSQNPLILALAQAKGVDYATMAAKLGTDEIAKMAASI